VTLTAGQLNRATLARQLLLERATLDVPTAVRRIVAIQAQEPASPYVALWNRIDRFDPADLDRAFETYDVVKATLMRVTLHAVHVDDHASFHNAMERILRASRLADGRFAVSGLTVADVDALVPDFRRFVATPRTVPDIEAMLEGRHGPAKQQLWWALRTFAPLFHAPTGPPWAFGAQRRSYRAAAATLPPDDRVASIQYLIRRYLAGFGPASVRDISRFTLMAVASVREALGGIEDDLVRLVGPDGGDLLDIPDAPIPDDETPAPPRLMAMWDSTLLAYADRSRIIPDAYRRHVIRSNGDVLPTILVDGLVAGVWRPTDGSIEVTAFHQLSDDAWRGLGTEAAALIAFLADRQPAVYGRYGRWWTAMPSAEVRRIP
jgi:hypothetical protein